jgi:hypothetical protein
MIQQDLQRFAAFRRVCRAQFGRSIRERIVVGGELVESEIIGTYQAQFFQIRIGEAPPPALIHPRAVRKHAGERALRLDLANTLELRVDHPLLPPVAIGGDEAQGFLQLSTKFILGQTIRSSRADSRERCGAQKRDEQKVIEMAGLECRILSIVGEAEQLAPIGRQRSAALVHPTESTRYKQSCSRATAFG